MLPGLVGEVLIEHAVTAQRFEQDLLIFDGNWIFEQIPVHDLGEQFADAAAEIGGDMAIALRLAVKGLGGMQESVLVDLDEGFERYLEAPAVTSTPWW